MIPKIIHYCWFGGNPLPELAERCIASWKEFCPDYEIIRWDENNTDLEENDYIREAYENKKWAFVSDYVRLKVLYKYGGVYMDTDVELIRNPDSFLCDSAFSGFENPTSVPTGIMAAEKGHPFISRLLDYYHDKHFVTSGGGLDLTTNVEIITSIASASGLILNDTKQTVCGMTFYPHDFFCPMNYWTGYMDSSDNTTCVHYYNGSWISNRQQHFIKVRRDMIKRYGMFGKMIYYLYKYCLHPSEIVTTIKWKIRERSS